VPDVNSALVSINPQNGAIIALVGGFDFNQSKFNRATQALRQVGSNIKPFLYTAAMDKGLTLASMLNDVPISRWDAGAGSDWQPKNSPPQYAGPIRLRQGLGQSKNVVMVRAMRAMGVDYAAEYLQRFGFPAQNIVHTESLALGSASFTPLQVARGYSVMANGGFLIIRSLSAKSRTIRAACSLKSGRKLPARSAYSGDLRRYAEIRRAGKQRCGRCRDLCRTAERRVSPQPQLEQANQALVAQTGARNTRRM
jgi:penicillin-binding protein 1A